VRRPQQHGSPSSGIVVPGCPDAQRALLAVRVHRQRPPVRCPPVRCVSGIRRPVSSVRCPPVRCPVPASGICVRVQVVRTGQFVERVDSHPARDRPRRHVTPPRSRPARRLPESKPGAWSWRRPRWQRRRRPLEPGVVTGDAWAVAWFDCLADREEPLRARIAVGRERGCVGGSPTCGRLHVAQQGHAADVRPTTTWVVGRPRGAALGRQRGACAAPPRPKAAGGPLHSSQTGRETRSDLGE
jgi:hypothetical protein